MIVQTNVLRRVIVLIFILNGIISDAQTTVSGGIFSNTTWTLSGSPYTVTGDIVVFPNVILTVEPGVVVKLENNVKIEIRQGQLIAQGTVNDSIFFTGKSLNPGTASWDQIYLNGSTDAKFSYCDFSFANDVLNGFTNQIEIADCKFSHSTYGINLNSNSSCSVDRSLFTNDTTGIFWSSGYKMEVNYCKFINNGSGYITFGGSDIKNCIFDSNSSVGIFKESGKNDTVTSNIISNNTIGYSTGGGGGGQLNYIFENSFINNVIGIDLKSAGAHQDTFFCNTICNNTFCGFNYELIDNFNVSGNYWCTNDSTQIANTIHDGYDNISFGLLQFEPIDTFQCNFLSGLISYQNDNSGFDIYPDPAHDFITINTNVSGLSIIKIYELTGKVRYTTQLNNGSEINIAGLSHGIYILELINDKNFYRRKFIKQ